MTRPSFDASWRRVAKLQGTTFHQKRGKAFTYTMVGNAVSLDTTNRALSKGQFELAWERMPVDGPGDLQDLQGPSYLWAILTDERVSGSSS